MFKTFLKRHEDSQDKTKVTAIPSATFEILRNTIVYLNDQPKTNTISERQTKK